MNPFAAAAPSLKQRLRLLVLLLIGLMLVAVALGVGSVYTAYQNQQTLTRVNGPAADANSALLQTLTDAETGLRGYQATHDAVMLAPFLGGEQRAQRQQAALRKALRPQLRTWSARLDRQEVAVAAWWRWANDARARLAAGGQVDLRTGLPLFNAVRSANQALGDRLQAQRLAAREASTRRLWDTLVLLVGAAAIASAAALYAGWRTARSLTGSIEALRSTVRRQRAGRRDARADENRGPLDVRELAADFNHLSENTATLEEESRQALAMQEMLLDLATSFRQRLDGDQILAVTAQKLARATDTTAAVFTAEHGEAGTTWSLAACWPEHALDESRMVLLPPVSQESIERNLWRTGRLLESTDLCTDELRNQPFVASVADQMPVGALLGTPLGAGERVIGALLLLAPQPRRWTTHERSALQQATAHTAQAFLEAERAEQVAEHVARLESLDRQKDDFVATVSHELRTPLTSISGYLEMLEDGDFGELSPAQRKALGVIDRNTVRLRGLIEDVLVLNRIESRELDPSFRPVHLGELVRNVVQDLAPQAATNQVRVRVHDLPEQAVVDGDAVQLGRALTNVLGNAVKFTPAGGTVTVSVTIEATRVRLTCRDTGIGIPAADLDQLFTRFFRAGNATARTIPGTGLGLAIVKAIVEAHRGTLEVHSVEDEGTTVVLELPRSAG